MANYRVNTNKIIIIIIIIITIISDFDMFVKPGY
jgi:hypothetical protein